MILIDIVWNPEETNSLEAGKMVQWVRILAGKTENLNLAPTTHMIENKNQNTADFSLASIWIPYCLALHRH